MVKLLSYDYFCIYELRILIRGKILKDANSPSDQIWLNHYYLQYLTLGSCIKPYCGSVHPPRHNLTPVEVYGTKQKSGDIMVIVGS